MNPRGVKIRNHRGSSIRLTLILAGCVAMTVMPASQTNSPAPPVYVVSYDHGGLVLWGYDHFLENFRALTGWLDRHPNLRMGLDNEAWMYDWLAENRPSVLRELQDSLKKYSGRLAIGSCTYGQPLAAWILGESNIRQVQFGLAAVRERLGQEVEIFSWSEHAGFPQLPQILSGLGMKGVIMRTHYLMYGYCPGYDVPVVGWQSPDGSTMPCVPTYVHQERQVPGHRAHPPGPFGLTTEDTWILTRYPSDISPHSLDHFRDRFAQVRPLVASRIDDSGLKREELVNELDARHDYQWVTLQQLFEKLPAPLEVVSPEYHDFGFRMPWGYRGNELFDLARQAEIAVLTAERLLARTVAGDRRLGDLPSSKPLTQGERSAWEQQLQQAWKHLLVGQHHDIQIVSRSGAMGRRHLLASLELSRNVLSSLLKRLATPSQAAVRNDQYLVFNPLPWPRCEARAQLPSGVSVQGQVGVASLGFANVDSTTRPPAPVEGLQFRTDEYDVSFRGDGGIDRLTTRESRSVLRADRVSGRLAAVIEGKGHTGSGAVKVLRDATGYFVEDKGQVGPLRYTIHWFFPQTGGRIQAKIEVRFNGETIGSPTTASNDSRSCFLHEQKLRFQVYPALNSGEAIGRHDVPFGWTTTDQPYVEGNYWTAIGDSQGGLAIANRGTMGSVRETDGAFSVPLAFSTDYVWGRETICGQREWELGLIPWKGSAPDAWIHREALEFAFPLIAVPGGLEQPTGDFLAAETPGLFLTAFQVEGEALYVRWFNGNDQPRLVPLPGIGKGKWTAVDLWHRPVTTLDRELSLRAWQFQTCQLPDAE